MSGRRPWQLHLGRWPTGAPMVSLGVHFDWHTPTLDLHLPGWTVQLGRNGYWGLTAPALDGDRTWLGGRVWLSRQGRWQGHTDNCDHEREP